MRSRAERTKGKILQEVSVLNNGAADKLTILLCWICLAPLVKGV